MIPPASFYWFASLTLPREIEVVGEHTNLDTLQSFPDSTVQAFSRQWNPWRDRYMKRGILLNFNQIAWALSFFVIRIAILFG
jgi:hypothetical protein